MTRIDVDLARRAVRERWTQAYSSPQDADSPELAGTVDECRDDAGSFFRVWCEDGTARILPEDESRDQVIEAVEAADVCFPEQVTDAALAIWESGGDWRAELARVVANDPAERRALDIPPRVTD